MWGSQVRRRQAHVFFFCFAAKHHPDWQALLPASAQSIPAVTHTSAAMHCSDSSGDEHGILQALCDIPCVERSGPATHGAALTSGLTCALCRLPIAQGNLSQINKYGFEPIDKGCYNALHSFERLLASKPEFKPKVMRLKYTDPDKFASLALRLKKSDMRSRHARDAFLEVVTASFIEEQSAVRYVGEELLTKRQFITHFRNRENYSEKEARDRWSRDKRQKYTERNGDNELVVAVQMPTRIGSEHRATHRSETKAKTSGADADMLVSRVKKIMDKHNQHGQQRALMNKKRERTPAPPREQQQRRLLGGAAQM